MALAVEPVTCASLTVATRWLFSFGFTLVANTPLDCQKVASTQAHQRPWAASVANELLSVALGQRKTVIKNLFAVNAA